MKSDYIIASVLTVNKFEFDRMIAINQVGDDSCNYEDGEILHIIECEKLKPTGNFLIVKIDETLRFPKLQGQVLKFSILTRHIN